MKKKILCLLLSVSISIPSVPVTVFANEEIVCDHSDSEETVSENSICTLCLDKDNEEMLEDNEQLLIDDEKEQTDNIQNQEGIEESVSDNHLDSNENNENNREEREALLTDEGDSISANQIKVNSSYELENMPAEEEEEASEVLEIEIEYTHPGLGNIRDIVPKSQYSTFALIRPSNSWDETTNKFYSQLDEDSKNVYDQLKSYYWDGVPTEPLTITILKDISIITGSSLSQEEKNEISAVISDVINYAFLALIHDEPEMSWLTSVEFGFTCNLSGQRQGNGQYKWTPSAINFTLGNSSNKSYTRAELESAIQTAKSAIDITIGTDRVTENILRAIHDYVCNNVAYASGDISLDKYQTPHSALLEKSTVCAGYAKSFKLLCDEYSIPCVLVSGQATGSNGTENHMWNYVKISGKWYAVDCTWDDQVTQVYTDYFLVGRNTVATHFGSKAFSSSHFSSGQFSESVTGEFQYPSLSDNAYSESSDVGFLTTVYVSSSGNDSVSGKSEYPVKTLDKALQNVKEGGVIIVNDEAVIPRDQSSSDGVLNIEKQVTIQGHTASSKIRNERGGIVLGANVTFKNIELGFSNSSRNGIVANGYTLTLDGVKSTGTYHTTIFAGTITEPQNEYPVAGSQGKVIIKGDTTINDIYAGNLSDLGSYKDSEGNLTDRPTVESHFSGDSTIIIDSSATGSIGTIYAYGGRENREGGFPNEIWGYNNPESIDSVEEMFTVNGTVTVQLDSTLAKNVKGASDRKAYVVVNSSNLLTGATYSNIDTLEVNGQSQPANLDNGVNLIVNSGARLDLSQLTWGDYTAADFTGTLDQRTPGVIVMNENYDNSGYYTPSVLTITGNIQGVTEFRTNKQEGRDCSGLVKENFDYILGTSSTQGNEFIFNPYSTQTDLELVYVDGKWTVTGEQETESVKPATFDIEEVKRSVIVDKSEINTNGVSIPITYTLSSDSDYLEETPLEITVTYGGQTVSARPVSDYASDGYEVSVCNMKMYISGDGVDYNFNIISEGGQISAINNPYIIEITVETVNGKVTIPISLKVNDGTTSVKTDISSGVLVLKDEISYEYNGTAHQPKSSQLELTVNGQTVVLNNTDFTYTYSNNIKAGSASGVTVKALNSNTSYTGEITTTFSIDKRPVVLSWKNYTGRTYGDGKTVTATVSNLINGDQVTVTVSGGNKTDVGTYTATATTLTGTAADNYILNGAKKTQSYKINKAEAPQGIVAERNVKWNQGGNFKFTVAEFSLPANIKNAEITSVTKNSKSNDPKGIFASKGTITNNEGSIPLTVPSDYGAGEKGIFDVVITSDTHENIMAELKVLVEIPTISLAAPKNKKIVNTVSGVHVYWETVSKASWYQLYRATSANGTYTLIKDKISTIHYTDQTAESGKNYYYKVRACNSTGTSVLSPSQAIVFVDTPDIISRINNSSGIKLGWNKIQGATGYAVYRKTESTTWARVTTISGNTTFTWTDTAVKGKNGTIYKYTVRALAGNSMNILSGCRNTGRTMVRLTSRELTSATQASKTSITCKWTTSALVTGYEVRLMSEGKVVKQQAIGNYKTGVKTITGLPNGKAYEVQVRSYKKTDVGTYYSAWSVKKVVNLK